MSQGVVRAIFGYEWKKIPVGRVQKLSLMGIKIHDMFLWSWNQLLLHKIYTLTFPGPYNNNKTHCKIIQSQGTPYDSSVKFEILYFTKLLHAQDTFITKNKWWTVCLKHLKMYFSWLTVHEMSDLNLTIPMNVFKQISKL